MVHTTFVKYLVTLTNMLWQITPPKQLLNLPKIFKKENFRKKKNSNKFLTKGLHAFSQWTNQQSELDCLDS